jgi:hypothetical protein
MTLFCPEGYVPVRAAIERAAQYWFPGILNIRLASKANNSI